MSTLTTFPHSNINFLINQETYPVIELTGEEALSEPFRFDVTLYMPLCAADENYLYCSASLEFSHSGANCRVISGIISSIECLGMINADQVLMRFRLQPRLARLHTAKNYQLILNETIIEISKRLLLNIGYEPQQLYFHCSKEYPCRPYTLQAPAESDLEFLHRLLANAGIFYWSSSDNYIETLHFSDNNQACPYLTTATITYIPPSYLNKIDAHEQHSWHFYDLHIAAQLVPNVFNVRDYHEQHTDHIIKATQAANIKQEQDILQEIYGTGIYTLSDAEQQMQLHAQRAAIEQCQFHAKGNVLSLCAGNVVQLDAYQLNQSTQYSNNYLILRVLHSFSHLDNLPVQLSSGQITATNPTIIKLDPLQASLDQVAAAHLELTQQSPHANTVPIYRNEAVLIHQHTPFCPPLVPTPRMPTSWISHVESNGDYPLLDEQSCYKLRHHFDMANKPNTQATIPIRRLMNYGGIPEAMVIGTHLPLNAGTEVLVSCLNGDLDCPVIIGSLPNNNFKSPVTAANKAQNQLITQQGNSLLFDDTIEQQRIQLATAQELNRIELNNHHNQSGVNIITTQGNMNINGFRNINLQSAYDMIEHSDNGRIHSTKNHYSVLTQQAEINYHAGTNQSLNAQQNAFLHAQNDIIIRSGQHITLDISENAHLSVQGNDCSFTASNGKINIQSATSINFIGGGQGVIQLVNNHAQLTIAADGAITCTGDVISLQAVSEIVFKGSVQM